MSTLIKYIIIVLSSALISACGGSSITDSQPVIKVANIAPIANVPAGLDATGNEVVTMDGSNSNDPDGSITNYAWTQTSGINVVITNSNQSIASFTAPNSVAQLGFQLTVTDNEGATNTQVLIVSTVEAAVIVGNNAPVANAGSDQSIEENTQVSLNGSSSSDPDGTIVSYSWVQTAGTPTLSITNSTLAVASFTAPDITINTPLTFELTVMDNDGANNSSSVVVTIRPLSSPWVAEYPELSSSEGLTNPSLAYGLTGVQDWSVSLPYLDIMKMSREWIGHRQNQWGGMTYDELEEGGYLDEHGWPTTIPVELDAIGTVFAWEGNEYSEGEDRKGAYVLTYEGDGDIQLAGIQGNQIINEESGHIVFTINNDQGVWGFNIISTDPNSNGNYIRNIKIIRQDRIDLYNSGAIFNPDWLENISDSRQIRFMDMMGTNNSLISSWSEIKTIDHTTWNENTPIEVLVRLANEIGADPWFNMPFHADDNYIRQFAEFVRDNLDSNLVAHVELSNEVWNFTFQQAQDSNSLAIALWNLDPNNAGAGWVNYYGKRASEVMKIWTEIFGNETESRLKRIAGVLTDWPGLSEEILNAPIWEANDPDNYTAPHVYFDALSPATYFGVSDIIDEDRRNALIEAMADTNIDNYDFHYRLIKGEVSGQENSLRYLFDSLKSQRLIADNYNLDLISYEGGQHVHHSAFITIPDDTLQNLQEHLEGFVRSQQMADLYEELWDEWRLVGTGPFMSFTDHSLPGQWGSWGLRASLSDTSPRVALIEQLNISTEAWWESRGGHHFQQGLTTYGTVNNDTLVGTPSEDYLIGSDGDDTFYPGPGNDGINGGAGNDVVLFKGNISDYTYFIEKDGYRVVGPEGSDYIFDVEELQFEDSKLLVTDISH